MPFSVSHLPEIRMDADDYRMATIRSHDQFNTTIYGMDDRYRGIHGERRVVFMNAADMMVAGVADKSNTPTSKLVIIKIRKNAGS